MGIVGQAANAAPESANPKIEPMWCRMLGVERWCRMQHIDYSTFSYFLFFIFYFFAFRSWLYVSQYFELSANHAYQSSVPNALHSSICMYSLHSKMYVFLVFYR
jgi:hypothetical protein